MKIYIFAFGSSLFFSFIFNNNGTYLDIGKWHVETVLKAVLMNSNYFGYSKWISICRNHSDDMIKAFWKKSFW